MAAERKFYDPEQYDIVEGWEYIGGRAAGNVT